MFKFDSPFCSKIFNLLVVLNVFIASNVSYAADTLSGGKETGYPEPCVKPTQRFGKSDTLGGGKDSGYPEPCVKPRGYGEDTYTSAGKNKDSEHPERCVKFKLRPIKWPAK